VILPSRNEKGVERFAEEVASVIDDGEVIISCDPKGKGKGWAIRQGLEVAKGNIIVFLDGDGDIPARMIKRLLPFVEDFDAVVGSKRITHKHYSRRLLSYLSRLYIKFMFGVKCDTQTGIKIFRAYVLDDYLCDGYLFDLEILCRLETEGRRVVEVPIEAEINRKMSGRAVCKTLLESFILAFQLSFPVRR
jgi:glycosyltransferase involved in cell wall biosynthesis